MIYNPRKTEGKKQKKIPLTFLTDVEKIILSGQQ